jgi:hypothetical protein
MRTIIIDLAVPIDVSLADHLVNLLVRELLAYMRQRTTYNQNERDVDLLATTHRDWS